MLLSQTYKRDRGTTVKPSTKYNTAVCNIVWMASLIKTIVSENWWELIHLGMDVESDLNSSRWSNHFSPLLLKG